MSTSSYTMSSKEKYNEIYKKINSLSKSASLSSIPTKQQLQQQSSFNKIPQNIQLSINGAKIINKNKKDKLVNLLVLKYIKKLELESENEDVRLKLKTEISKIIQKEKLNEEDLKNLETKLISKFKNPRSVSCFNMNENNPNNNINNSYNNQSILYENNENKQNENNNNINNTKLPPINKTNKNKHIMSEEDEEEFINYSDFLKSQKNQAPRKYFGSDEWAAVIKYGKLKYEQEELNKKKKLNEKLKNYKNDLKIQIQKNQIQNKKGFQNKSLELNEVMKDVELFNKLEKEKEDERKRQRLITKNILTKQLIDEQKRKKINSIEELKKDKEYIDEQLMLDEQDRRDKIIKKENAFNAYQVIIKENEERKLITMEQNKKERERDIKAIEDYSKELDRLENLRKDYFKRNSVKMGNFGGMMVEQVINVNKEKRAKEDATTEKYFNEREEMLQLREDNHKKNVIIQKKTMRGFLNKQIEAKKKDDDIEKIANEKQLDLYKADLENFENQERERNRKVFNIHILYTIICYLLFI